MWGWLWGWRCCSDDVENMCFASDVPPEEQCNLPSTNTQKDSSSSGSHAIVVLVALLGSLIGSIILIKLVMSALDLHKQRQQTRRRAEQEARFDQLFWLQLMRLIACCRQGARAQPRAQPQELDPQGPALEAHEMEVMEGQGQQPYMQPPEVV
jgi:hypothetical protein